MHSVLTKESFFRHNRGGGEAMAGPTGAGVGGPIDGASKAIQTSRLEGTQEQSGMSRSEQAATPTLAAASVKINSQIEVLNHINNYFTALQGSKTTPTPTTLGGYSSKGLVASVGTELEYLESLVAILSDNLPKGSPELTQLTHFKKELTTMLTTMRTAMSAKPPQTPKLSSQDLHSLSTMLSSMNKMVGSMPAQPQAAYWTKQADMFIALSQCVKDQIKSQAPTFNYNYATQAIHAAMAGKNGLNSFFSGTPPLKLTQVQIQQLLTLYNNRSNLTTTQNAKLQTYLSAVYGITVNGKPLINTLASAETFTWMQQYLAMNPNATEADVKSALNKFISTLPSGPMKTMLQQILGNFSTQLSKFGTVGADGKITLLTSNAFYAQYVGTITNLPQPPPTIEEFYTDAEVTLAATQNQQLTESGNDLVTTLKTLGQAQEAATTAADLAIGVSPPVTSKNLGAQAPSSSSPQEAPSLAWSNQVASIYNTLLGDTAGFANADKQFTFSSLLNSPTTHKYTLYFGSTEATTYTEVSYAGTVSVAQRDLANEKKAVAADLAKIESAQASIKTTLENLGYPNGVYNPTAPLNPNASYVKSYNLTITQVRSLASHLSTQYTNLSTASTNLTNLQTTLDNAVITYSYMYNPRAMRPNDYAPDVMGVLSDSFSIVWGGGQTLEPMTAAQATAMNASNIANSRTYPAQLQQQESNVVNGAGTDSGSALGNISKDFTTQFKNASSSPTVHSHRKSLQQQFANDILNHYMPLQEAYLENKAHALAWSNQVASIYNTLLGDTTGFANANTQLTFSNMLSSPTTSWYPIGYIAPGFIWPGGTGTYTEVSYAGTVSGATQALSNEKKAVAAYLTKIKSAKASIKTTLENLGYPNGVYNPTAPLNPNASYVQSYNLTITQVRALGSNLAAQHRNLSTASTNLHTLQTTLKEAVITPTYQFTNSSDSYYSFPPSTLAGSFSIAWNGAQTTPPTTGPEAYAIGAANIANSALYPPKLESEESNVVNGAGTDSGSALGNIGQNFTTQSQNASNTSQTAQMQLQMTMTEMQQKWTVTSTALQIFNQMYMSVAQAIYSL